VIDLNVRSRACSERKVRGTTLRARRSARSGSAFTDALVLIGAYAKARSSGARDEVLGLWGRLRAAMQRDDFARGDANVSYEGLVTGEASSEEAGDRGT